MEGFVLAQISSTDPDYLAMLEAAHLSPLGLDRAEAYVLLERESSERVAYGALEIYAPNAMLRSLVVPNEHRGQGYATTLCRFAFAQAAARGVTHVYALTETAPGFFEAMGFRDSSYLRLPRSITGSPLVQEVCSQSAKVHEYSLS